MKKYIAWLSICLILLFGSALYALVTPPLLLTEDSDDTSQNDLGKALFEKLLYASSESLNIRLQDHDLSSLSSWINRDAENSTLLLSLNKFGLTLTFTRKIDALVPFYINAICFYSSYQNKLNGEGCTLGRLEVRNSIVEKWISWSQKKEAREVLNHIVEHSRLSETELVLGSVDGSSKPDVVKPVVDKSVSNNLPYSEKVLLEKHHLELMGGFTIPRIKHGGMRYSSLYIDNLPGTNKWVLGHPDGFVVVLDEPGALGKGSPSGWPLMKETTRVKVLHNVRKLGPTGVFFRDKNTVIVSGRKSYRSGFEAEWLAEVNLNTHEETRYQVVSTTNLENDNFHLMQSLGGGFMRITDDKWSAQNLNGAEFLLGRGGYDVLGSPLGPSLGLWNGTNDAPIFLLNFPKEYPARRDPYYTYPNIDPNTYNKAKLRMWKMPDNEGGYWQAGDVGGIAFVNHPSVKGIVVTHNFGRGVHDYRAQGDIGSGKYFLVADPTAFYSEEGIEKGDRAAHSKERGNQAYPRGLFARGAQVYEPEHLSEALTGRVLPYDTKSKRFDWPRDGIDWSDDVYSHTQLGSILWDNERQLLWLVFGSLNQTYVAAYSINLNNSPSTQEQEIPTSWLKEFEQSKSLESSLKGIIN
ncbi:hypothetical protein ACZ81_13835 [Alteromonas macleodii]|uniref:hypothetical protein n=1 Tax=Alteromonas macleodii TaxID=28108 RepID=UPI000778135E|nr:hypothetical protein [Alteromonas macleodii]AMN12559.1 hypothetical protein ACZ81_13835 [Alteromonas macleodii]|tara:strand:+ start:5327 stop:7234 length:1908 start_codon:yes stop_codon:yes gene_type:complete